MEDVLTLPRGRPLTYEDLAAMPFAGAKFEIVEGSLVVTPQGAPFTREHLDDLPEDGWRHELIGGALVMTPAPSPMHQGVSGNLYLLLRLACPADLRVRYAPLDVAIQGIDPDLTVEVFQPDLLVARHGDFTKRDLPVAPLLAVEILSPATSTIDRTLKKDRFEAAACPSFWIVDPIDPRLTAWELRDRVYVEVADVRGDEEWTSSLPYPVTIRPTELLD